MSFVSRIFFITFFIGLLIPSQASQVPAPWLPALVNEINEVSDITPAIEMVVNSPSELLDSHFTINWQAFGDEGATYTLEYRDEQNSDWLTLYQGSATRFDNKQILPGGSYQVRLTCLGTSGCPQSGYVLLEVPIVVVSPPEPVNALTTQLSADESVVTLIWSASAAAQSYQLEQQYLNQDWQAITQVVEPAGAGFATSLLITGSRLSNYRISACNEGGCSEFVESGFADITPPLLSAPAAAAEGYEFELSWPKNEDQVTYLVKEYTEQKGWYNIAFTQESQLKLVKSSGNYQYAYSLCTGTLEQFCGKASNAASVNVSVGTPPNIRRAYVAAIGYSFVLEWDKNHFADSYIIEETTISGGSVWQEIASTSDTSLTLLRPGINDLYFYRYKACVGTGSEKTCGALSGSTSVELVDDLTFYVNKAPAFYNINIVENANSEVPAGVNTPDKVWGQDVNISWPQENEGDVYYLEELHIQTEPYIYKGIAITSKNVFSLKKGNGLYAYQYRVCSEAGRVLTCGKASRYTNFVNVNNDMNSIPVSYQASDTPPPPVAPTYAAQNKPFAIKWPVTGDNKTYLVQEAQWGPSGYSWDNVAITTDDFVFQERPHGNYFYRYAVCEQQNNSLTCGEFSGAAWVQVMDVETVDSGTPPTIMVPEQIWKEAFTLYWSADSAADYYQVQELDSSNNWWNIAQPTDNELPLTKVMGNYQYRYSICINNQVGSSCGDFSEPVSVSVASVPVFNLSGNKPGDITVIEGDDGRTGALGKLFTLNWAKDDNADVYLVQEVQPDISSHYNNIKIVSTNSWYLRKGKGYYAYRYAACQLGGGEISCGPFSNDKVVDVISAIPPKIHAPAVVLTNTVEMMWVGTAGAQSYVIEALGEDNVWQQVALVEGKTLTLSVDDGFYQYRYKACTDAVGTNCGWYSQTITVAVATDVPPPMNKPLVIEDENFNLKLSWPGSQVASSYLVQQQVAGESGWQDLETVNTNELLLSNSGGQFYYRYSTCSKNDGVSRCGEFSLPTPLVTVIVPVMEKALFEWQPAVITAGEKTTFRWNVPNAETCFSTTHGAGNSLEREPAGENTTSVYLVPGKHITKWYCEDKHGNRFPKDNTQFLEAIREVKSAVVVNTFEWQPSSIPVGGTTSFVWDISNVEKCFVTGLGDAGSFERAPRGNNGQIVYNEPETHITRWYCEDTFGNRYPADEEMYLEAVRTVGKDLSGGEPEIIIRTELLGAPVRN